MSAWAAASGVAFQGSLAEPPKQRAVLGEDEGEPVGGAGDPLADGADGLVQLGRGHILAEQVLGRGTLACLPSVGSSWASQSALPSTWS
jgi:hypothetical protein